MYWKKYHFLKVDIIYEVIPVFTNSVDLIKISIYEKKAVVIRS